MVARGKSSSPPVVRGHLTGLSPPGPVYPGGRVSGRFSPLGPCPPRGGGAGRLGSAAAQGSAGAGAPLNLSPLPQEAFPSRNSRGAESGHCLPSAPNDPGSPVPLVWLPPARMGDLGAICARGWRPAGMLGAAGGTSPRMVPAAPRRGDFKGSRAPPAAPTPLLTPPAPRVSGGPTGSLVAKSRRAKSPRSPQSS